MKCNLTSVLPQYSDTSHRMKELPFIALIQARMVSFAFYISLHLNFNFSQPLATINKTLFLFIIAFLFTYLAIFFPKC